MNTTAAGRHSAIFCQSGPTPAVRSASLASSRAVGALSRSVMPWPAAMRASSAVSIGGARRQDPGQHQPAPERPPEAALVVVAGLDADRRRVEADEQQSIAERRQVGERLDRAAVDQGRRDVRPGVGSTGERLELVRGHGADAVSAAAGRGMGGRQSVDRRRRAWAGSSGGIGSPAARAWISAWALLASVLGLADAATERLARAWAASWGRATGARARG